MAKLSSTDIYGNLYVDGTISGTLNGKALQDSAGQQINTTYIKGLSISGRTITYTKGNGTTGTITTQDTNTTYNTGNASTAGLTKLYTGTGTATDGTMTQAAIKSALDGKAASSHGTHVSYGGNGSASTVSRSDHTHSYLPLAGGTLTGSIKAGTLTSTWVDAAKNNKALLNSTATAGNFSPMLNAKTTNGSMILGFYQAALQLSYITKSNVDSNTNTVAKSVTIMDEAGNGIWPGSLTANGGFKGNADTATTLQTARTINGTSFNGSGNITTANWGTARTLTIGNKGQSVNGSGNVTWSLSDIGAAASDHKHGLLHSDFTVNLANTTTDNGWSMINSSYTGYMLKSIRTNASAPIWICNNYAAGIAFGGADTKGVISCAYNAANIKFAGGNGTKPTWWLGLSGTSGTTYNLANFSTTDHTHTMFTRDSVGDIGWETTSNRTLPVQVSAIAFWNGAYQGTSSNLAYCKHGAFGNIITKSSGDYLPISGGTMTGKITTPNNAPGITFGDDATICDRNIANHIVIEGATATAGGITFGSGKDTNIYRGGANLLKTDDTFNAVGGFQWNGTSLDNRYAAKSHTHNYVSNTYLTNAGSAVFTWVSNTCATTITMGYKNSASNSSSVLLGCNNTGKGEYSYIIGHDCLLNSGWGVGIGKNNKVYGTYSFTGGTDNKVGTSSSAADYAHAVGYQNTITGGYGVAVGNKNTVSGVYSIALGYSNKATGQNSSSLGSNTSAKGYSSTAIGNLAEALGESSVATGYRTTAGGTGSFAEGYSSANATSIVSGYSPSSTTYDTIKSKWSSTKFSLAHGNYSHCEGYNNIACGKTSHAEGWYTMTKADCGHAGGYYTVANLGQYAIGHYNTEYNGSTAGTNNSALIVGNGKSDARSNACRITFAGEVIGKGAYKSSGADYAEYFEWLDGNPNAEDRRGYFVTMDEDKIKIAKKGDYILGIVSAYPAVIGNNDMEWQGQFLLDDYGAPIKKMYKEVVGQDEETGEDIINEYEYYVVNPDYDPNQEYVHREDRPEWDAIGMMGVLWVNDDGTCKVNGFCECNENGIATASEKGYRVIKRVNDHIVKVLFR